MNKFKRAIICLSFIASIPMLVNADNVQLTQSETIDILTKSVKKLIDEQKELKERISVLEGQKSGMIKLPDNEITVISGGVNQIQKTKVENNFIVLRPSANVRQEPNIVSPVKQVLNIGTVFEGNYFDNDWVKMPKGYISTTTINKIDGQSVKEYLLSNKTIMRSSPKISNKNIIETLDAGKKILIYDIKLLDNWYKTIGGAYFQKQ